MVLLLVLQLAVVAGPFDGCAAVGDNLINPRTMALDILKNRATAPASINPAVTLEALLQPHDDRKRWHDTDGATIEGIVRHVGAGGLETSNCHKSDVAHKDTHIDIELTKGLPAHRSIVVEVTPRWRAAMKAAGVDWSTAALSRTLTGKRVRVTGWLMLDIEHVSQSDNTHLGAGNWRASAWELHPVTDIKVQE